MDLEQFSGAGETVVNDRRFITPIAADGQRPDKLLVCRGTGCSSAGSVTLGQTLKEELGRRGLAADIEVVETGCFGFCRMGPIMVVNPGQAFFCQVQPDDVPEIVGVLLEGGQPLERLMYRDPTTDELIQTMSEIDFFGHQERVVLKNCGRINPEDIDEYIAFEGYFALATAVREMTPGEVVDVIKKSGLRGRGGAGFPTGLKWEFTRNSKGDIKYVICNADEGDPGAFMDRSLMEGDPHSVLEGMMLAGYAIGSNQGYVYIRAEYPIAVHRLEIAIRQAREKGLLGRPVFDSSFSFDVDIRLGAGAFVCGEETALINSIEGDRGEPRPKPPYPAVSGLWGKPTLINNVETLANVPRIIRGGWEWFAERGTPTSKGTKVFALAGKINNTGLIEVPMGTPLRTIIYDIGGGIPHGHKFKAAQTGGPSGGCIPAEHLDVPVDFDSLIKIGSMMGSGGMIVMDETDCMVDIARFYLDFNVDESCGRCPPCRIGTKRMFEILTRITEGKGQVEDLYTLESLGAFMKDAALCGLGQTAPNPVLSTLRYFREEYEAHIKEKRCPAGVCKALRHFRIDPDKCRACSVCTRVCPAEAITGERKKGPFVIDPAKCIKCGACVEKCPVQAVIQ